MVISVMVKSTNCFFVAAVGAVLAGCAVTPSAISPSPSYIAPVVVNDREIIGHFLQNSHFLKFTL